MHLHSSPRTRLRIQTLLVLTLCSTLGLNSSMAGAAEPAHQDHAQQLNIPAQSLASALTTLSRLSNTQIFANGALLESKQAPAINAKLTTREALNRLLQGSGLIAVPDSGNHFTIHKQIDDSSQLPEVAVQASAQSLPGDLPKAYAGGQVARGGKLGLLGDKDFMETPFSQTTYTAKHIQDTQAKTIGEVLESSPSVRRSQGRSSGNDTFIIRGFSVPGSEMSYDGMYGLANVRRNAIEAIERVELLKGPSALLNGVPPGGSIGGSVNLVPKRATDKPITDITLGYVTESSFSGQADVGRRYGTENQFGVRVNAFQRDGDTVQDYAAERMTLGSVALDYRGDRIRLYANFNYEKQKTTANGFQFVLGGGLTRVPRAPDNRTNPNPPWTFTETERNFNLVRGEYDINQNWTASLGYGWQHSNETQYLAFTAQILDLQGTLRPPVTNRYSTTVRDFQTVDAKLHGKFETGPVNHQLAIGAYKLFTESKVKQQQFNASGLPNSNLYDLQLNYSQPSFSGRPVARTETELTLEGLAVSDTLSVWDDRAQLTLGARRQSIKSRNALTGITSYDESATTPAVAIMVRPLKQLAVYANYIEGLTQITPSAGASNPNDTFTPAKTKQREVGLKVDLGRIATTLAYFEITQPSGFLTPLTQVYALNGEQINKGIELETFGELTPGIRVLGGVTWMDPKLSKTLGGLNDGNKPVGIPEWAASIGTEWDVPLIKDLTLTARVLYNGTQYLDQANLQQLPSWTRFDIGSRYLISSGKYPVTLRANITNLFNRDFWENGLIPGPPRMGFMSATIHF